ncbi:MAG: DUF503 domain-containing protein [Candidatus Krumholzibacteria bacterium]|nr:DUF503 domain-containing protein [Candidatus Krumholzibacteria bacterium]MDH4336491.1 DUF503 domain-containing protein [Candidatus Krumholzibacteria bacterium]MDH5269572.1 DUF503 domain-containing protein [Candidatus Krumholzibacteria bacterium]
MFVKLLTVDLLIPGCSSLKEKRYVLSSLKARLRSRFNVSVAEVDFQDKWQRSMLAVSLVGTDHGTLDGACAKVRNFIENDRRVTVADTMEEFR